jgi:hypothetical protein
VTHEHPAHAGAHRIGRNLQSHRAIVSHGIVGDGAALIRRARQAVVVIGDAARAGKSKEAIASAFEAALLDRSG